MSGIAEALREAAVRLATVSPTARLDAEVLMAHALGMGRAAMLMRQRDLAVPAGYQALIDRRAAFEPVAYITGVQPFWDLDLIVTPDVLIPRADSESLIEAADEHFSVRPPATVLDLGTGSGALLLAALSLFPRATGVGVDVSVAALAVAARNAERTKRAERCRFCQADWCKPGWQRVLAGPFDLILANPPYVESTAVLTPDVARYEPARALFAGPEGLDDYAVLLPALPGLLASDGIAIVEIGWTQADPVVAIAAQTGLVTELRYDLGGRPRALIMRARG